MKIFRKNSIGYNIIRPVLITVTLLLTLIMVSVLTLNIITVNRQIEEQTNTRMSESVRSVERELNNSEVNINVNKPILNESLTINQLSGIQEIISEISIGQTGRAFLVDNSGKYIAGSNSDKALINSLFDNENKNLTNDLLSGEAGVTVFNGEEGTTRIHYAPVADSGLILAIIQSEKEINEPVLTMILQMLGLMLLTQVILVLVIIKIVNGVVQPIVLLTGLFENTQKGDYNNKVPEKILNRQDELGKLGQSFQILSQNIQDNINILKSISEGDLNVSVEVKSDQDIQAQSFIELIETLKNLSYEVNKLTRSAKAGKLGNRGDASSFKGKYGEIVLEINETLDAVITPLNLAADYVDKISRGMMPSKITSDFQGDFNTIKNNLNNCIDNINTLVADVNMLSKAAMEGQLEIQADVTRHSGDYQKIVQGFNNTLNAILVPINEAKEVMIKMSNNDLSLSMDGLYQGKMQEFAEEINNVHARLLNVQRVFGEISTGDTQRLEEFTAIGKRSENDQLIPAIISTFETIDALIVESQKLAQAGISGDLSVRSDISLFSGRYRQIVEGFNQTLEAIDQPINEAAAVLSEMSTGNLAVAVTGDYQGSYGIIKNSLNHTLAELNEILGNINRSSDEVAAGSRQVSDASQALAQGATEQASSMEELTASINEVAYQTRENEINANRANGLSAQARENAENGNTQMQLMLSSMDEMNQSSSKISNIIKVIDEIAFQTNILALNAAVEAARAGEHGKGFAVVAEEVRSLAGRCADAAQETAKLIEGSIENVETGSEIAHNTAAALTEIVKNIVEMANLVASIDQSSSEQTASINQINIGVDQVSQVVQNNSATAEESAAASEELYSQAELLKNMVSRFKLKD